MSKTKITNEQASHGPKKQGCCGGGSTNLSRRSVLQGVTSGVVAAPIILTAPMILTMTNSALATKMSKAAAGYQNHPKGNQSCANCKFFILPSSCTLVEGPISPRGWCRLWVSK
jgi:hypothetical protein